MVTLYVAGKPVGTLADLERVMGECAETWASIEFRDTAGKRLGIYTPSAVDVLAEERLPPYVPTELPIEPGYTLDEMRRLLGWDDEE